MAKFHKYSLARAKYHQLYKLFAPYGKLICYYCGEPTVAQDHCPSLVSVLDKGTDFFYKRGIDLVIVPSCADCNSMIGSAKRYTPNERRQLVKKRMEIRYARYLTHSLWTQEELDELGPSLREQFQLHNDFQIYYERRYLWPQWYRPE